MSKKAIILLSGGIDSATTLFFAKKKGFNCTALIFDYGQRHKKEIISAERIAGYTGCRYQILKLQFPWKGSSLLDKSKDVPHNRTFAEINKGIPSTYVPSRNIIFLSIAFSFAEAVDARAVFMGAHTEDYSGYPDCRGEFFDAFRGMLKVGTKSAGRIKLYTPLLWKNKTEIVKLGLKLGVPFELTWSCYTGLKRPCRRCDSCLFRQKAFKELKLQDPLLKR